MRSIILLLGLLVLLMAISPSEQRRRRPKLKSYLNKKNQEDEAPESSATDPQKSSFDLVRENVKWELLKAGNSRIRLLREKLRQENAEPTTPLPPVVSDECGGCEEGQYCHKYFPECGVNDECDEVTYVCSPVTTTTEAPVVYY